MTDKLGWIVAGALAALIVGYLLGRRHTSSEPLPPPEPMPLPEPQADRVQAAPQPSAEPPRRSGSVPPPAPAGHLPPGVAPPASTGGGSFLGGARPATQSQAARPQAASPGKAPAPSGPPAPTAPPPPARTAARPAAAAGGAAPARATQGRGPIAGLQSWGYQLQNCDARAMAGSPYDLIVIDYSKDGSGDGILTPAELERLKQKPDGARRAVISYLSIGEAESYRSYWQESWKTAPPAWLVGENPDWNENYAVRFWDPAWQALMFGSPEAYLDHIVAQGFDGVYLDKCDVTDDLGTHYPQVARERQDLERDMVDFVARLAAHARNIRPGFAIIMQNAEPLLRFPELRAVLDGVGKEELYFGLDGGEGQNDAEAVEESRRLLSSVRTEGKAVLVVEYLSDRGKQRQASELAAGDGFTLFLAHKNRELASLGSAPVVA